MHSGYKSVVTCMWSPGMAVTVDVVSCSRSGLPVRTELKETSVIHRLWSSLMPVTIRLRERERESEASTVVRVHVLPFPPPHFLSLLSLLPPFFSFPLLPPLFLLSPHLPLVLFPFLSLLSLSSLSSLLPCLPSFPPPPPPLLLSPLPFSPPPFRGGGEVEDAPVSVVMHVFAGETVVIAVCRDLTLKLWSCQVSR